jgi:hypothetical protein
MPRIASDAAAGLLFPGAYEALLDLERERNDRDDERAARTMGTEGFRYRRGRRLAERLEAGEWVVVDRAQLGLALTERDRKRESSAPRPQLPFGRGVRRVRVSPDDLVLPDVGEAVS